MKHWLKILHVTPSGFASFVRIHLALSVILLFTNARALHTVVTAPDKTSKVEKTVEALHVDFSSKVPVPEASERFTPAFLLLTAHLTFGSNLAPLYSLFTQFPSTVVTNPFYVFTRINAP